VKKTGSSWGRGIASALLCLAATAEAAAEPSPLLELKPVAVEVDITGLPASEQAALVPLLRAARQLDTLYVRQVWPGTRALIRERQSAQTSAAQAELDALNLFKGPWGPTGTAFIGKVPSERPIGDFYPFSRPARFLPVPTGASRSTEPPPALTLPGQPLNLSHSWPRATRLRLSHYCSTMGQSLNAPVITFRLWQPASDGVSEAFGRQRLYLRGVFQAVPNRQAPANLCARFHTSRHWRSDAPEFDKSCASAS
jgi:hypothetical protein